MGLKDFISGQFIDVIEYIDESDKILVAKYNRPGNEIKQGAQVIVRESQAAVFLSGGKLADILGAGTHTLNTGNLPLLSTLGAFAYGFNSPVKADVYFISLKQFTGSKWGTKNPMVLRDPEFNMVRVRAFGNYAFRVIDTAAFMKEVFGTKKLVLTYDIIEYLSAMISEAIAEVISEAKTPFLDFAARYHEFSDQIEAKANEQAAPLGIAFSNVIIENISVPEEVEKLIDEQSGIGMASKNMNTFMQYQTARAMRDAAQQEGGLAGLGAGMALGNTMANTVGRTVGNAPAGSSAEQLRELKALLDEGVLTEEEFAAKKKQILGL